MADVSIGGYVTADRRFHLTVLHTRYVDVITLHYIIIRNGPDWHYTEHNTHTHTHASIHIHTYIYTYIHRHIQTYMHACIHIHTYIYTHTYKHAYIHTYIQIYIHTYIHTSNCGRIGAIGSSPSNGLKPNL